MEIEEKSRLHSNQCAPALILNGQLMSIKHEPTTKKKTSLTSQ